jgi:hypothetical protein
MMMSRKLFLWTALIAVSVVFAVHVLQFPGSVPDFQRASAGGTLLDAVPAFTEEEIYRRLAKYGEEGRRNYAFRNLTVDIVLPLAVFPFLLLLMLRAIERAALPPAIRVALLALPVIYVLFDLAENGLVLALLSSFPHRLHVIAAVLPYVTVAKRAASLLALLIPAGIFLFFLVRPRPQN